MYCVTINQAKGINIITIMSQCETKH